MGVLFSAMLYSIGYQTCKHTYVQRYPVIRHLFYALRVKDRRGYFIGFIVLITVKHTAHRNVLQYSFLL